MAHLKRGVILLSMMADDMGRWGPKFLDFIPRRVMLIFRVVLEHLNSFFAQIDRVLFDDIADPTEPDYITSIQDDPLDIQKLTSDIVFTLFICLIR